MSKTSNSTRKTENYRQNSVDTNLALALYKLDSLQEKVEGLEIVLKQDYVTKAEFEPVKTTYVTQEKLETLVATLRPSTTFFDNMVTILTTSFIGGVLALIGIKIL